MVDEESGAQAGSTLSLTDDGMISDDEDYMDGTDYIDAVVSDSAPASSEPSLSSGSESESALDAAVDAATHPRVLATSLTSGPYLQSLSTTSVIIAWRTSAADTGKVSVGTSSSSLPLKFSTATSTVDPQVTVTGLTPNTKYFYEIATSKSTLKTGLSFTTAPQTGSAKPTRMLFLGECGTGLQQQTDVITAMRKYQTTTGRAADLIMIAGDAAYETGTDAEYGSTFFGPYNTDLRTAALFTAIGNHDSSSTCTGSVCTGGYFTRMATPRTGESGGVASNSAAYYSLDYGNIHVVVLDSFLSDRTATGAMLTWLKADLKAINKGVTKWLVAMFHHSPYSKGAADCDANQNMIDMRANAMPLLEDYGVDLVVTGHSKSYERTMLIDGFYGDKVSKFSTSSNAKDTSSSSAAAPYVKPPTLTAHKGTVAVVVGTSGDSTSSAKYGLSHPACVTLPSSGLKGSIVNGALFVDFNVEADMLYGAFVTTSNAVIDQFWISKAGGTPSASPSPSVGAISPSASPSVTPSATISQSISPPAGLPSSPSAASSVASSASTEVTPSPSGVPSSVGTGSSSASGSQAGASVSPSSATSSAVTSSATPTRSPGAADAGLGGRSSEPALSNSSIIAIGVVVPVVCVGIGLALVAMWYRRRSSGRRHNTNGDDESDTKPMVDKAGNRLTPAGAVGHVPLKQIQQQT